MNQLLRHIFAYLKAIAWVVIPFCMIASLHYLFVFFPRSFYEQDNHIYFNNMGLDYWGIIVGFFTLIVTLLVGWQIFSTIRERERNEQLTDEIRNFQDRITSTQRRLEERLTKVEDCCENRKEELKRLIGKVNESFDRISAINENYIADIYNEELLPDEELTIEYKYLSHRIQALIHISNFDDLEGCNLVVNNMIQTIKNIKPITMSSKWRADLIEDYLCVKHSDKIVGYVVLKELLENIKIVEATVKNKPKRTKVVRLKRCTTLKSGHSGNIAAATEPHD